MDVVFKGLTKDQAKVLAEWFAGQGEQDCDGWFQERGVPSPTTDVYKGSYKEENGQMVVYCHTP